jgi:hypothetical protein
LKSTKNDREIDALNRLKRTIEATREDRPVFMNPSISTIRAHIGEMQTVEFEVAYISGYGLNLYSMHDPTSSLCFAVFLDSSQSWLLDQVGINDWHDLFTRRIRVKGQVERSFGRLQIKITDLSAQFELFTPEGKWIGIQSYANFVHPSVAELRKSIGRNKTVVFRVQNIGGNDRRYLNSRMNYKEPEAFSAVIEIDQVVGFKKLGLNDRQSDLRGRLISVNGTVQEQNGLIQIHVTDLENQFKFVDRAPTAPVY